jgi:biopolymer transport protein ExbD
MTILLLQDEASPMMEMNTTPLIDVLLVLLIMFIITIPPITNGIEIDLPSGPIILPPDPPIGLINKITVQPDNSVAWNGTVVTLDQLELYLMKASKMVPEPELQFQPAANANYETVDRTLAKIKGSGIGNFGFVGNEQYREFGKAERSPN